MKISGNRKLVNMIIKYVFFFLYTNEFEINNPLGLHATFHSISTYYYIFTHIIITYYSFPFEENNLKLSNIFLVILIKHIDFK